MIHIILCFTVSIHLDLPDARLDRLREIRVHQMEMTEVEGGEVVPVVWSNVTKGCIIH